MFRKYNFLNISTAVMIIWHIYVKPNRGHLKYYQIFNMYIQIDFRGRFVSNLFWTGLYRLWTLCPTSKAFTL